MKGKLTDINVKMAIHKIANRILKEEWDSRNTYEGLIKWLTKIVMEDQM